MGILRFVTLTGAGEATCFETMVELSIRFPFTEWAVLYSPDQAGKGGRYPSLEWLEEFAAKANEANLYIALHLCGRAVTSLVEAVAAPRPRAFSEEVQRILDLAKKFDRVQVNMIAKPTKLGEYRELVKLLYQTGERTRVIMQWNQNNEEVCRMLASEYGFETLFDASGGRGITPKTWPEVPPYDVRRPGFAGGLGPDNIRKQLSAIDKQAGHGLYWVDMEGKLRDDQDVFDLSRCEAVLVRALAFMTERRRAECSKFGEGLRDVCDLEGLWLDWWVARALGYGWSLVVPPEQAVRTMLVDRGEGSFYSFAPSEDAAKAARLLAAEKIALLPSESGDSWEAFPVSNPQLKAKADDMLIAGLRALVLMHYGATVPMNLGDGL